jgi:hypothetical protein
MTWILYVKKKVSRKITVFLHRETLNNEIMEAITFTQWRGGSQEISGRAGIHGSG